MKILVFLGPTLEAGEAREILAADYLPPVQQGDIYRALAAQKVDAIAIVDGIFEDRAAVWHKEVLWALSQGIVVYGAASMGALRAAELDLFGMVGIGKIYESYKSGRYEPFADPFEGDDEVAVVHGPSEASRFSSLALVNLRESLHKACQSGIIDRRLRDDILLAGKKVFYKDRTIGCIQELALDLSPKAESFARWLPQGRVSQKREDAKSLLRRLRDAPPKAFRPAFSFEWTAHWQRFVEAMESQEEGSSKNSGS